MLVILLLLFYSIIIIGIWYYYSIIIIDSSFIITVKFTTRGSLSFFSCRYQQAPKFWLAFCIPYYIIIYFILYNFLPGINVGRFIFSSVPFSRSVMSHSLWPQGLQHTRPHCPSLTPTVYPNSCPLSQWCHPTVSCSVVPFSSHLQSFPALGSLQMSQHFTSGGQSIGVSASTSVLPMNTQDWFPLGWTGWISLKSKGLSRIFSNTTVQKHQFFSAQFSL